MQPWERNIDHRVRYSEYAVSPAVRTSVATGVHFSGRDRDDLILAGDIRCPLVMNLLSAGIYDGDHQPVVIVAGKLVVAERAPQNFQAGKLGRSPADRETLVLNINAHGRRASLRMHCSLRDSLSAEFRSTPSPEIILDFLFQNCYRYPYGETKGVRTGNGATTCDRGVRPARL